MQLVNPIFYEVAGNATDKNRMTQVRRLNNLVLTLTLMLTGLGIILSYFLHDLVFSLFAAPEYHQVSKLLPWMLLSAGLLVASQVAGQLIVVCFQTRALLLPHITTGLLGLLASFTAARLWGLSGVVTAGIIIATIRLFWILKVQRTVYTSHISQI
jgi:O-antigen/teichoic acid export membrane protein